MTTTHRRISSMKKLIFLLLVLSSTAFPQGGGRLIENPLKGIPKWVRNEFTARHLDQRYSILFRLYPHFLRGDFNGDDKRDVVIQIEETSSGKLGIAIFHTKKVQALYVPVSILGAGKQLGKAGDDFKWVEVWSLYRRPGSLTPRKPPMPELEGDAIKLSKRTGKSGLVYWDGKNYSWHPLTK
jgi:hypothetical protein